MFSYVLFAMAGLVWMIISRGRSLLGFVKQILRDTGKGGKSELRTNNSSSWAMAKGGDNPPLSPVTHLSEKRYCSQARTVLKRRIRMNNGRVHSKGSSLDWVELSSLILFRL